MHQSGQLREQSMHTVQFSDLSAITPRARGAGASFSCGYCTVTAPCFTGAGMRVLIPRFREDQLQAFAWKYLIPISLVNILVTMALKVAF